MPHFDKAVEYIKANKSFRSFENDCNVPADKSPEIWAMAALHLQDDCTQSYTVSWEIDIDAPTPELAAQLASEMLEDLDNTATFFKVRNNNTPEQDALLIDVSAERNNS